MPDRTPASPRAGHGAQGPRREGGAERGRVLWLLPVVTFALGVLLGGVGAGVGVEGDIEDAVGPAQGEPGATTTPAPVPRPTPAPSPSPSPSPRPSPTVGAPADVTIAVPGACLEVAGRADQLAELVRDAAEAAGRLDAAQLSDIVRQLEESQVGLDALSGECRAGTVPAP